jgi:hypothetical protein
MSHPFAVCYITSVFVIEYQVIINICKQFSIIWLLAKSMAAWQKGLLLIDGRRYRVEVQA